MSAAWEHFFQTLHQGTLSNLLCSSVQELINLSSLKPQHRKC